LCGVIVRFDDLQSKTIDKDAVPFVGEMMVSRWAFEALAIDQFKNNRYMAQFFDMEKEMAQSRFRADLLTTELIGQIDLVSGWQKAGEGDRKIEGKLTIIKNEVEKLNREGVQADFIYAEKLNREHFTAEVADSAKAFLNRIKNFHSTRYQQIKSTKDQMINQINREKGSSFIYNQKMAHHSRSLEALVLNSDANEFYRETPSGIMQKVAPAFKAPDFANGRAHFFAPYKNLFGLQIDTLKFNLGVIWLISTFLYIALYFDWLRKLLHLSGKIKIRKR
jgi:hypothetical protein